MEDFEDTYVGKLWHILLNRDKRSFNEYFSEEHGITLNDDITDRQLCFLCKVMMRLGNSKLIEVDSIRQYMREDDRQEQPHDKIEFEVMEHGLVKIKTKE